MWQERGKTTHLKVAKKWGKEEGEGFSFVLPQLVHHSAVSSWIFGEIFAEKWSVPHSVSWCSGLGQQLFLEIRVRECSRCSVSLSVSHTCCIHTDSYVYWNVDVCLYALHKYSAFSIAHCFLLRAILPRRINETTWAPQTPVCHTSGVSSSVASFTAWFFEFSTPQTDCLPLLFCFLNCSVLF